MRKWASLTAICGLTSGCAQTPPVQVSYFGAKASLSAKLVRTLGCDKDNLPVVATTPTVTVTQVADPSKPLSLDLSHIDGAMANSDTKMEFYADRRLKTVNATTTGQGETILKSAISLAAAVAMEATDNAPVIAQCQDFKKHFGDQTLTLIYTAEEPFDNYNDVAFVADAQSTRYASMYSKLVGDACLRVKAATATKPVTLSGSESGYAMLGARQPAMVPASVSIGPEGTCQATVIWSGYVPVGQAGVDYQMPIPRAALFGKQAFSAAFDESGALTSVEYGKEAGEGSAINVAQAAFDAFHKTDAEKATDINAEASVIAAQQHLVKCQTSPASC